MKNAPKNTSLKKLFFATALVSAGLLNAGCDKTPAAPAQPAPQTAASYKTVTLGAYTLRYKFWSKKEVQQARKKLAQRRSASVKKTYGP